MAMSSLAAQLAQSASLNATLLTDRSRGSKRPFESYLFTGREASQHDLESIHALGVNGFLQLASLSPALRQFEEELFSERTRGVDRTLLTKEESKELDGRIRAFLPLLGPFLMDAPTGKVLEWLVRRFRINEFNVESVLALFLPYHESPHFAKMVTILHIKQNSTWNFLLPYKSSGKSLSRVALVTEMLQNSDLARFVVSLLPTALAAGYAHRVLLAFNAVCLNEYIIRMEKMDEGTVAFVLPALMEPLQRAKSSRDATLGAYILLSTLSQKNRLSPAALQAIIGAMTDRASGVSVKHFVNAMLAVCEAQDELESFTAKTVQKIMDIGGISDELKNALAWFGVEKLVYPLLPGLTTRLDDEKAYTLLEAILIARKVPSSIAQRAALALVKLAVIDESEDKRVAARQLLSVIHQRYPSLFSQAVAKLGEDDEGRRAALEQLVVSISMGSDVGVKAGSHDVDIILAASHAESSVRCIAVKDLLSKIAGNQLEETELESVHSALLARVEDTSIEVLEALYSQPSTMLPILVKRANDYIHSLMSVIATKPKRNILRIHLNFVASQFCQVAKSHLDGIFYGVFFPLLLFSKPRHHTADVVWEIVSNHLQDSIKNKENAFGLLNGCTDLLAKEKSIDGDSVDNMNKINLALASQIATNILVSDHFTKHFDTLVDKLEDSDAFVRLLSYLIVRALFGQLTGEHKLHAARKVLSAMHVEEFYGAEDLGANQNLADVLEPLNLGRHIISKPNGRTTLYWLQISVLSLISAVECPTGVVLDWLMVGSSSMDSDSDKRGPVYIEILRRVYRLVNSKSSAPRLSIGLLQVLFDNLKDDALAFLAGMWMTFRDDHSLCTIALRHASSFLEAHVMEGDGVDFQTILPSLLVALNRPDGAVRLAALDCISRLHRLTEQKLTTVYKFDAVYGQGSKRLQYLDQQDLKSYVNSLVEHQEHLAHDNTYLSQLHTQLFAKAKGEKKRSSEYKHRILCYLLSHVDAIHLLDAQLDLLKSLSHVKNSAKAHNLLSTIRDVVLRKGDPASRTAQEKELACYLVSCLDASVASDLNESSGDLWNTYERVLRVIFNSNVTSSEQIIIVQNLQQGLFAKLSLDRKVSLCMTLLEIGTQSQETYASCKQVLSKFVGQEVSLLLRLLVSLQPNASGVLPRVPKRPKVVSEPSSDESSLTLFAEVLGAVSLPGSLELVSHLLETINRLLQAATSTSADLNYTEQLLMSAIENSVRNITEIPNLSPAAFRLEILVELIRVAGNPQTFHQALLLMAKLARLAPESVLRNVMPVFTFMGSNVFHRDDTYSFNVVQQTVDSIVPVMVASLKKQYSQTIDLYIGSKEFLRVFTEATNHIPRHRRTNFFVRLVEVLGARDFLPPVCMLLVEKVASRVARQQDTEEVHGSLLLPISIFHHNSPELQILTLAQMLHESQRLTERVLEPSSQQPVFLEVSPDDEHTTLSATYKRRAQALITFVGYAASSSLSVTSLSGYHTTLKDVMTTLISLATVQVEKCNEDKVSDIQRVAKSTLKKILGIMSMSDFVDAVLSITRSQQSNIQAGALGLLSDRIANVSGKARQDIVPAVVLITKEIQKLLTTPRDDATTLAAYAALKSIGATSMQGEEACLAETLVPMLGAIKERTYSAPAFSALAPLPVKLGPRLIPYFRQIVQQCADTLREGIPAVMDDTFLTVHGMLVAIPTFWGSSEVAQIVTLCLERDTVSNIPQAQTSKMLKDLSKRASPKALFSAIVDMWPSVKDSQKANILLYVDFLARVLRAAPRSAVLEHVRPLFKLFLESFEQIRMEQWGAKTPEAGAFKELVVKLNEAAFRPLFRRLYDWAFANDPIDIQRKITFCHVYITLLDFFKGLMTPYMSFLLEPFISELKEFSSASTANDLLWLGIVETFTKSLSLDDGAFWRDDKLRKLALPMIEQVPVCVKLGDMGGKKQLQSCLNALVDNVSDDALLKTINLNLLMHTRSEDVRIRMLTLTCSESLWQTHGGKLLGFAAETMTFIAECSEDENDMVVRQSLKLKDAVENVAGNISGL